MKFLLVFIVLSLGAWLWRHNRKEMLQKRKDERARVDTQSAPQQAMVSCARCGVHLPQSDAIPNTDGLGGAHWFCSVEHRKLGVLKG